MAVTMRLLPGISKLADEFDGFIIDLWGVLHDGTHPYPGALEALQKLHATGRKILLLSNAPRRAFRAEATLTRLGFQREWYQHLLTSGEATFDYLLAHQHLGHQYVYIGPEKDRDLLINTPYMEVGNAYEAGFVLNTGFDAFGDDITTKLPQVEECLEAGLPMVCANPDRTVVKQSGEIMLCAGVLADWYEQHSGEVHWFGKPYPSVYEIAQKMLNISDASKICAIGDSLHTDVAGANARSIHSVLCSGGILAERLGIAHTPGTLPLENVLQTCCAAEGVTPRSIISRFVW